MRRAAKCVIMATPSDLVQDRDFVPNHSDPLNRACKIDRRALAKMLDPALPHPDATRNPHVVPFTRTGGTDTGNCPNAC
ncbi:hypothetical protein GCM10009677_20310 [Sphaerisporangium rubeum]